MKKADKRLKACCQDRGASQPRPIQEEGAICDYI